MSRQLQVFACFIHDEVSQVSSIKIISGNPVEWRENVVTRPGIFHIGLIPNRDKFNLRMNEEQNSLELLECRLASLIEESRSLSSEGEKKGSVWIREILKSICKIEEELILLSEEEKNSERAIRFASELRKTSDSFVERLTNDDISSKEECNDDINKNNDNDDVDVDSNNNNVDSEGCSCDLIAGIRLEDYERCSVKLISCSSDSKKKSGVIKYSIRFVEKSGLNFFVLPPKSFGDVQKLHESLKKTFASSSPGKKVPSFSIGKLQTLSKSRGKKMKVISDYFDNILQDDEIFHHSLVQTFLQDGVVEECSFDPSGLFGREVAPVIEDTQADTQKEIDHSASIELEKIRQWIHRLKEKRKKPEETGQEHPTEEFTLFQQLCLTCAERDKAEAKRLILHLNVNPNQLLLETSEDGTLSVTPVSIACLVSGDMSLLFGLISDCGADADFPDHLGRSPLLQCCRLISEWESDPNHLSGSLSQDDIEVLLDASRQLLVCGADPSCIMDSQQLVSQVVIGNEDGQNPLCLQEWKWRDGWVPSRQVPSPPVYDY